MSTYNVSKVYFCVVNTKIYPPSIRLFEMNGLFFFSFFLLLSLCFGDYTLAVISVIYSVRLRRPAVTHLAVIRLTSQNERKVAKKHLD